MRALYDLQGIARSNDSFLCYADVEEKIKQAMASKLERFIGIRTRSIHKSVSEWAKWEKCGVKSIVEWINAKEKNNREIKDMVKKRQRERLFPTQSTHKTEKEHQRKGQCSVFHNKTNIYEWFYIPREHLVLISEGTFISIPTRGIKHITSLSYKSTLYLEV